VRNKENKRTKWTGTRFKRAIFVGRQRGKHASLRSRYYIYISITTTWIQLDQHTINDFISHKGQKHTGQCNFLNKVKVCISKHPFRNILNLYLAPITKCYALWFCVPLCSQYACSIKNGHAHQENKTLKTSHMIMNKIHPTFSCVYLIYCRSACHR
jgi:hypothetical protein